MRQWCIPVFIFFVLVVGACSKTEETIDVVKFQPLDYQIYLFSNRTNKSVEKEYIDAILTLQRQSEQQKVLWNKEIIDKQQVPNLTIKNYPSIIILKDGEIIKEINGPALKNEIMSELYDVLSFNM